MNNKGFTLAEVLTVMVIGSIIGTIAIISTRSVLKNGEDSYYKTQKNMIVMAAKEYYSNNKNELPVIEEDEVEISLKKLEEENYIDKVKDSKGNSCSEESKITVRKENNGKYTYKVDLICLKGKV